MNDERVGKWLQIQAVGWFFGTVLTACGAVLHHWIAKDGNRPDDWMLVASLGLIGVGLLGLFVVFVSQCVLSSIAISTARKSFRIAAALWIAAMIARATKLSIGGPPGLIPGFLAFYSLRSLMTAHQVIENSVSGEGQTFERHFDHHRKVFLTVFAMSFAIGMLGLPIRMRELAVQLLVTGFVAAILTMETRLAKAMWRLGKRMRSEDEFPG